MHTIEITHAECIAPHQFKLRFSDALEGTLNVRSLAQNRLQAIFAQLNSVEFASRAQLAHGTLCWPGELDVAPEYLYFLTFQDRVELHPQFKAWGYLT